MKNGRRPVIALFIGANSEKLGNKEIKKKGFIQVQQRHNCGLGFDTHPTPIGNLKKSYTTKVSGSIPAIHIGKTGRRPGKYVTKRASPAVTCFLGRRPGFALS
jgi:hypothetical protein